MNVHFGYDRAGPALDAYAAVSSAYGGPPAWVGRYSEQIEGTSTGLTIVEAAQIHGQGMAIALVYNGAEPKDVAGDEAAGSANGAVAVKHLQALKAPPGVCPFFDQEAGWWVNPLFNIGMFKAVHAAGYVPGCYLNAQDAGHVAAFLAAISATGIQGVIWSSEPEYTVWLNERKGDWYDFSQTPLGPHAALVGLHQYGENELAGAVDLDVANDVGWGVLWHPTPIAPAVLRGRIRQTCALKPSADNTSRSIGTLFGGDVVVELGTAGPYTHITATLRAKGQQVTGYVPTAKLGPV